MKKAAVFFATGFEEIEALTVVDILRRVGVDVTCVSIDNAQTVTGAHSISVGMNAGIAEITADDYDILVCPGGMPGTKNLEACHTLTDMLIHFDQQGKLIGAICAAPMIFGHLGFLQGREACIYPGMEAELTGAQVTYQPVTQSGHVITSRGMGTAIPFALTIVSNLIDQPTADKLATSIVYR